MRPFFVVLMILLSSANVYSAYGCSLENANDNNCRDLIKLNTDAGLGRCLAQGTPQSIPNLLQRNNIELYTGNNPRERGRAQNMQAFSDYNDPRVVAVARVVEAIDRIGDGRMTALEDVDPIEIVFANPQSTATNSRRIGNQIQLTGGNQNQTGTAHTSSCGGQDNHALIAHEIGHYIAGNNNSEIMNKYLQHMNGEVCRLTNYCTRDRGEEIAEVIAAYITMPQAFDSLGGRAQDRSCQKALEFMKETFGEDDFSATCRHRQSSYRTPFLPTDPQVPQLPSHEYGVPRTTPQLPAVVF